MGAGIGSLFMGLCDQLIFIDQQMILRFFEKCDNDFMKIF
jgi:hypothetical protein